MRENILFVTLLDANVLYPAPLRDFLLRLAEAGLFIPKWSAQIPEEWMRNLLLKRPDLKFSSLEKLQQAMDSAFPDANVTGYNNLMTDLHLPDKGDIHVLAAAIKSMAHMIITFNRKDFPEKDVSRYKIEIKNPDEFIIALLKKSPLKVLQALHRQVNALKNPPQTIFKVLNTLENCGLPESIAILRKMLKPHL